jgi:hypothetical protein
MPLADAVASRYMDAPEIKMELGLARKAADEALQHVRKVSRLATDELQSEFRLVARVAGSLAAWLEHSEGSLVHAVRHMDMADGSLVHAVRHMDMADGLIADTEQLRRSDPAVDGVPMHDEHGPNYIPPRLMGETETEYNHRKAATERKAREDRMSARQIGVQSAAEKATAVWRS